jgi:hypothetical protein
MATELEPIVGDWYSFRGRDFTVVDVDEDEGIVEIQYASGAVQQIDLNAWYDMDLEPSEEPEDWDADVEEDGADSSRWDDDDDEDDEEDLDDEDDEDEDDDWDDEDDEEEDGDEWEGQYRRRSDEDDSWDEH